MQDLQNQLDQLRQAVETAMAQLDLAHAEQELKDLQAQSQAPNFWQDTAHAQQVMKRQAQLEAKIKPWRELKRELDDLSELVTTGDSSLEQELREKYSLLSTQYSVLQRQLQFSGPYDDHAALLSLYAGAGGTDAQDWTQMLLRMYTRWAEQQGLNVRVVEESPAEEAGLKSATLEIDGPTVYGRLKGEHGVHRLVRLSPFNSDHKRQTSFAKVDVLPKIDHPSELSIDDKDLKIDVFRSGGHGGQSVNTTDSAVRVTHLPTGLSVAIQNERSQLQNKETAMTILRSRLAQLQLEQHRDKLGELKGPNQSAEWGNQIRSYVLHPYKQVKDLRTGFESSDPETVLNGDLEPFIEAYLQVAPEK